MNDLFFFFSKSSLNYAMCFWWLCFHYFHSYLAVDLDLFNQDSSDLVSVFDELGFWYKLEFWYCI